MKRRRVKITGIGPVTPAGIGREEFWKGITEPVSRIRPYTKIDPAFGPFVAAAVDAFHIEHFTPKATVPKGAARHTLFALAASVLALRDAGVTADELKRSNSAVVAGACVMDFDGIIRTIEGVGAKGIKGALGRTIYTTNGATMAATVSEVLQLGAVSTSVQSSCCTGLDAIGLAARMISHGEAEIAICGGADAPLYRCPLVELRAVGMTPETTENAAKIDRPFDLWRTTGVVSEGACMFVLEPESSPRPGYAFVGGYAFENDNPDDLCSGMAGAMEVAIADASLRVDDIDSISAWGPGHRLIDAGESRQLQLVFGKRLNTISAVSIKGAIGNPLGAAGAIQVAAAVLGHQGGVLPPTVNWDFPDPSCPLNLSRKPRYVSQTRTLVNAHGLAGVNSSLVLTKC